MNKAFEKILGRLEDNKSIIPVNRVLDDIIKDKPKELGQLIAYDNSIKIVMEVAEEYNGGWIACSERLPEDDKKQYIVQATNGFIDILRFTKDAYKLHRYDFAEYRGKKKQLFYDYDSEYGYSERECVAWQPLPEPYKAE